MYTSRKSSNLRTGARNKWEGLKGTNGKELNACFDHSACFNRSIVMGSIADPMLPAHILIVSIPAPGHVIPSTALAYQLAARGMQVTYLTSGYVFQHLQHRGDHKYVHHTSDSPSDNGPRVRFEALLESEAVYEMSTLAKMMEWQQALTAEEMRAALERRFRQLQPAPCCIVADMLLEWVQDVADKFRVPRLTLVTVSANSLAFLLRVPELVERGELPFTAAGAKKKDVLLPGMAAIIHAEDIWESLADGGHPSHQKMVRAALRVHESSSIIVNTFDELEAETFKALRTDFVAANIKVPEILPILLSDIPRMQRNESQKTSNREDQTSEVEKWLDTQAPGSVIYVSFGSLATLSEEEIVNLALALEAAKYPFLWVCRPPGKPQVNCNSPNSATRNSQAYFPPGFGERVCGRAMMIFGWAPQPQILTHEATGAFLTHCGWNSVLESVCAGVPMLAWPIFADQIINARFITDTAQVGLRIHRNADDTVHQDEIEKVLEQMMDGEEGKSARSNALTFERLAQKNVAHGGASRSNLDQIVQQCTPASLLS